MRKFCVCIAIMVTLATLPLAGHATPLYKIKELPLTRMTDMNDKGEILGGSLGINLWLPKPAYGLPAGLNVIQASLPGGIAPYICQALNNKGEIVGRLASGNRVVGMFLWLPEPEYGLNSGLSVVPLEFVSQINDDGQIAGDVYDGGAWWAAIWSPETAHGVGPGVHLLGADRFSGALAINNKCQAVGYSGNKVFLWLPEADYNMSAGLHTIAERELGESCSPIMINDIGDVLGYRAVWDTDADTTTVRLFLWLPNARYGLQPSMNALDIGLQAPLAELAVGVSASINDGGRMAGTISTSASGHSIIPIGVPSLTLTDATIYRYSFIWDQGTMYDPIETLDSTRDGWSEIHPQTINNKDQIAGWGVLNGERHTFLMTPIRNYVVSIDIKPGDATNSINLTSKGVIPVAILTTTDFDVAKVNIASVVFAGAPPCKSSLQDVDLDGDLDLILHFKTQSLRLGAYSTSAVLTGETLDGDHLEGTDSVSVIMPRN